jgi:hypothetical protein
LLANQQEQSSLPFVILYNSSLWGRLPIDITEKDSEQFLNYYFFNLKSRMKPHEIMRTIEEKTFEFRAALESQKSNEEVITLYWQIKQLKISLLRMN